MENNRGIIIFLGAPFSGKETQTTPLSQKLAVPVFSMGHLIREARVLDPEIERAFQEYTVKGLHVPIDIKFSLLRKEMEKHMEGFILDNFPASQEDLDVFNRYISESQLKVNKVFYLKISHDEMIKRFNESSNRGRADDTIEALQTRSTIQSQDREPVLEYFKNRDILVEINGEQDIEKVADDILKNL